MSAENFISLRATRRRLIQVHWIRDSGLNVLTLLVAGLSSAMVAVPGRILLGSSSFASLIRGLVLIEFENVVVPPLSFVIWPTSFSIIQGWPAARSEGGGVGMAWVGFTEMTDFVRSLALYRVN